MSKYKRSNARDDNMTELILGSGLYPWSRKKKRAPFQKILMAQDTGLNMVYFNYVE